MRTRKLLAGLVAWAALAYGAEPGADATAAFIASQVKLKQGLAVDVGCGEGSLAITLARATQLKIHCVDSDSAAVAAVQQAADAAGLYGNRITAESGNLAELFVPDRCANLVFCGDGLAGGLRGRDFKEIFRILSPNGVALIGGRAQTKAQLEEWLRNAGIKTYTILEQQGAWARITQPRGEGWDEWTHRGHDAGNSFGSLDTISGSAFKPHWVSACRPGVSSAAIVAAHGRLAIATLAYDKAPQETPYLQVLDAYSGVELWAKTGLKELPVARTPGLYSNRENCCDIATADGILYLLGGKVCHVIDLETGEFKAPLNIPAAAQPADDEAWLYLSCAGDLLFGASGASPKTTVDWNTMMYRGVSKAIFALDRKTGAARWCRRGNVLTSSLAVAGGRVYCIDAEHKIRALDSATGTELFAADLALPDPVVVCNAACHAGKYWVLYNKGKGTPSQILTSGQNTRQMDAYSAKDGKHLFKCDFGDGVANFSFSGNIAIAAGQHSKVGTMGVDIETGKQLWKRSEGTKCTPSLASANLILERSAGLSTAIFNLSGIETNKPIAFAGFRPTCAYPAIPANGMLYVQAEGCNCVSPIRANLAIVPGDPAPAITGERLSKGPSYGKPAAAAQGAVWATWRADAAHSGRSSEKPTLPLRQVWQKQLAGELTPLAIGGGLVFCGSSHNKIVALDAATGQLRWKYFAANRIEAPPFLEKGCLYFSDDDGLAYCLNASTGAEVWRFCAALGRERIIGYEHFMSRWPAKCGVLVRDGIAYVVSGLLPTERMAVFALDAVTGEKKWEQFSASPRPNFSSGPAPQGILTLSKTYLYIPCGTANAWRVELEKEHALGPITTAWGAVLTGLDESAIGAGVGAQYVHHVRYKATPQGNLSLYAGGLAYTLPAKGIVAQKSTAHPTQAQPFKDPKPPEPGKEPPPPPKPTVPLWTAWKNDGMTAIIEAGGILLTGGRGKVYATDGTDGKELWNAAVPGDVRDLAFVGGRLFVLCDAGEIVCFDK